MQKLTLIKRLVGLENLVNESRTNSNLPINFLFRETKGVADDQKLLFLNLPITFGFWCFVVC